MPSLKETLELGDGKSEDFFPGLHVGGEAASAFSGLAVGQEVTLRVRAKVSGQSEHERDGKTERSMSFEMREAEVVGGERDPAEVLFGGDERG